MRKILFLCFLTVCWNTAVSQHTVVDFSFTDSRKLGPVLMESTFYIYSGEHENSSGTAFVLAQVIDVDSITEYKEISYGDTLLRYKKFFYSEVLITAAHILKQIEDDFAFLCLRKKVGDSYENFDFKIKIRNNGAPLWKEPNGEIDVAALRIKLPDEAQYTILTGYHLIDSKILPLLDLNSGDDLLCLGFPYNTSADEQKFPILRSGKFASYRSSHSKNDKSFLFDFQVYPGNSGGPVYIDFKTEINPRNGKAIFSRSAIVGVVSQQLQTTISKNVLEVAKVIYAEYIFEAILRLPTVNKFESIQYISK